jgi:diaminohydroxyphosphoribosylaminopyrimidine deaminase/5-amino-6-(5-phosphoribosylamino)uracil reductase
MRDKLPYVVLKTATTMDGKIATRTGDSKWITCDEARCEVYRMRREFDCILTSSNTIIADNPSMEHKFKCILDKDSRISREAKIYQQGQIYIADRGNTSLKDGNLDLRAVLEELYKKGIYSVFVECGGKLAGAFLKENLIDEIYQFIAPKIVNDNSAKSCFNGDSLEKIADCKKFKIYDTQLIGDDVLLKYYKTSLSGLPDREGILY